MMSNAPRKWLAVLLSIVAAPLAFLYVGRARWAGVYLLVGLTLALYGMFLAPSAAVAGALNLAFLVVCAAHAYRLAKGFSDAQARPWFSRWYGLVGATMTTAVLGFAFRAFAYEPFRQPSASMLPTIPATSHLVVQKWGFGNYGSFGHALLRRPISAPLERGDIIVFEFPKDRSVNYVKRLVGLPGDKVSYRGKKFFVNDEAADQRPAGEYVDGETLGARSLMSESILGRQYTILLDPGRADTGARPLDFPLHEQCTNSQDGLSCQVPAGHFFVLGDNRDNSNDSRYWGFVPADHIVGKLVFIGK